jgi:hypothetical protein
MKKGPFKSTSAANARLAELSAQLGIPFEKEFLLSKANERIGQLEAQLAGPRRMSLAEPEETPLSEKFRLARLGGNVNFDRTGEQVPAGPLKGFAAVQAGIRVQLQRDGYLKEAPEPPERELKCLALVQASIRKELQAKGHIKSI